MPSLLAPLQVRKVLSSFHSEPFYHIRLLRRWKLTCLLSLQYLYTISAHFVGIGSATALLFAKAGAHVVITARRVDRLQELSTQIKSLNLGAYLTTSALSDFFNFIPRLLITPNDSLFRSRHLGGDVVVEALDVRDKAAFEKVAANAKAKFGKIDILGWFCSSCLVQLNS